MTSKRLLFYIIFVAIVLRLLSLLVVAQTGGPEERFLKSGDAPGYVQIAESLWRGDGFARYENGVLVPQTYRTIGFPLMLAPFVGTSLGLGIYLVLLGIISGILIPLITYELGRRIIPVSGALIAALLTAIEPHLVFYGVQPLTEVPFTILSLGGLLVALYAYERRSFPYALCAGFLLGYATLVRPGFLWVVSASLVGVLGYLWWHRNSFLKYAILIGVMLAATLSPWYARNYLLTGTAALSGAGWRNVYTDYVASVRSLENSTPFHVEKQKLFAEALPRFGIKRSDVANPAYAGVLRDAALQELWEKRAIVLRLEPVVLASFFVHDDYYFTFRRMGFIADDGVAHESSAAALVSKGITGALPVILSELKKQWFIPIAGRLFTVGTLLAAGIGFFLIKNPLKYLLGGIIFLTALVSTTVGLAVTVRFRVPVEPILFIFASVCFLWIYYYFSTRAWSKYFQ